jgi:hypothetical protein
MRSVSELYGRHAGADIYVVGTGTSVRVFPLDFLKGKITIALNQAWKLFDPLYAITMMPKLNIPEFIEGEQARPAILWISKPSKVAAQCTPAEIELANTRFYGFENDGHASFNSLDEISDTGRVLDWVRTPHPDKLYLWTSISQSAMNLAANMGARNIILVGCDNAALAENHHAHGQHTMWRNEAPDGRYMQYYEGVAEVRAALRKRGVNVISATPFVKLDGAELDFRRLCRELEKPDFIANVDIARGNTLWDENMRFVRLATYVAAKNARAAVRKVRAVVGTRNR